MSSTNDASSTSTKKLVFKVTRKPVGLDAPSQDTTARPTSPLAPVSPVSPAPALAAPKPSRFVFKPSASNIGSSGRQDDLPSLDRAGTGSPRPIEIVDLDPPSKKRDLDMDVDTIPVPKRRKELEVEDEIVDVSGVGGASEAPRKKWVPMRKMLNNAMKKLIDLDGYKFFYEPVTAKDAPDYFAVIKKPMDFVTMRRKVNEEKYPYWNLFVEDFELICQNCITFNLPNSIYWNEAKTLLLEGKKYLKMQGARINPHLLVAPPNFDASAATAASAGGSTTSIGATGSANPSTANAAEYTAHRPIPTLSMPKRLYLRNDELPLHLLAPPPPVHLAKLPPDATPRKLYNPTDDIVAKHTPQQQKLLKVSTWQRYRALPPAPTTPSHWGRVIPNYIQYTRGYPGNKRIAIQAEKQNSMEISSRPETSTPPEEQTHVNAQRAYYLKVYRSMQHNSVASRDLQSYYALPETGKRKFEELSKVLRSDPQSLSPNAFCPKDVTSQVMDIDTSALIPTDNLLTLTTDEAADLKNLRATLASSHIDLSFLDTLFQVDSNASNTLLSSALSTSNLLTRNSQLIQRLNSSMQSRRAGAAPSDTETAQLQELTENLMMLLSTMPKDSIPPPLEALDRVRAAVELGLPSVPDVTPLPFPTISAIGVKKEHPD